MTDGEGPAAAPWSEGFPGGAGDVDRSPAAVYRWTCPVCGESRAGIATDDEAPSEKAALGLRQHVRSTTGNGHGPAARFPRAFDPDATADAVSILRE